jgi:archaellum biogenesis ATPase FlaH
MTRRDPTVEAVMPASYRHDDHPPPDRKANGHGGEHGATRSLCWSWADDLVVDLDAVDLVEGAIPTAGLVVFFGGPGSGKTALAVDLAAHIATGLPWFGRDIAAAPTLYVAAEAPASTERRLVAWKVRHEVAELPLAVVQSTVNLLAGDATAVLAVAREVERQRGAPVALIVIDTLARAMGGDENAAADMSAFVAACDQLREATGAAVVVVHHSGKDEARGARGHSALKGAVDVEIEVTAKEGQPRVARVAKLRDGPEGECFAFTLDSVELGEDRRGRMVTSAVVAEVEGGDFAGGKGMQAGKLTSVGKIAVDALEKVVRDCGEQPPQTPDTKGVHQAVRLDQWRRYFQQVGGYSPEEAKESAFRMSWKRARESALGSGRAKVWGDWAWLSPK